MASTPRIYVVSGMQGAGKTTVAVLLARRFARGAHIEADALQKMIVSGRRWPEGRGDEMSAEAIGQLRLRLHNACLLARSFVECGITAVVDDIVIGSRVDDMVESMAGAAFNFVMLTPRPDVVRAREAARGTQLYIEYGWMDDEIRSGTRRLGRWIDNSDQTAEETVDEIMLRTSSETST
jgi:predicted kinase